MSTSGSIEIPFAAEWSQLRRDRVALRERLARLDAERGKVSEEVFARVRADYLQRQEDLELRTSDLAQRAGREATALSDAVGRQEESARVLRAQLEEFDLRERLGEKLEASSARRAAELRRELHLAEDDLIALVELRDRVTAIAEGRSSGYLAVIGDAATAPPVPSPPALEVPPALAEVALPPLPPPAPSSAPPPPGAGVARLVPVESTDARDFYALAGRTIVGRGAENDLRLPVGTVSRRHAEIERIAGGWLVRDLHSENGTWVNGERIWEQVLVDGDQVQFGTVCLVFHAF
ncbi:MAG TPA: FHA domain-containing protein [Thermoanaerobaculia bacterium]|nr:FHA domain-containing protein [Thermoanaerobaculia bacterium]